MVKWWIFFLSLMTLCACQHDVPPSRWDIPYDGTLQERREWADSILHTGKYFQGSIWAQNWLDTIIAVYPEGHEAYRIKSLSFTKKGDFDQSFRLLETAMEKDSAETLYYYSWLTLFHFRDYAYAYQLLNTFDDLTPGVRDYAMGANVNYLKGLALKMMGKYEEAIDEFNTALRDEGPASHADIFIYRGIAQMGLKRYAQAKSSFLEALKKNEKSGMAMYYLSLAQYELGQISRAEMWMKKAGEQIVRGNKKTHPYVEVFDEVHFMMVQDKLKEWVK